MLISPYLYHTSSPKGKSFYSRRGYPYIVSGLGAEWPIIQGDPNHVTVYLEENEVFEEGDELVTYIAVLDGELTLVQPGHLGSQQVSVAYIPDSKDVPSPYFVRLNLGLLGARAISSELIFEKIDPLSGIIRPTRSFQLHSARQLSASVCQALRMSDTMIGGQLWCLTRGNEYLPPKWRSPFQQQHTRLADRGNWLTKVWDRFELSPGFQGPRIHSRFFEPILGDDASAFGIHAETLDWWRTLRSLTRHVFRLPSQGPLETHMITNWHAPREALFEALTAAGQGVLKLQIAPAERIQGCNWDGVVLAISWDGQPINLSN